MSQPAPIAIVGGGPCGLTFARLLDARASTTWSSNGTPPRAPGAQNQGGSLDLHTGTGLAALEAAGLKEEFDRFARYEGRRVVGVELARASASTTQSSEGWAVVILRGTFHVVHIFAFGRYAHAHAYTTSLYSSEPKQTYPPSKERKKEGRKRVGSEQIHPAQNSPFSPRRNALDIRDIEPGRSDLILAVLSAELIEPVLAAPNSNHEAAVLDHALGHGDAEAGRAADHEDRLILPPHRHYLSHSLSHSLSLLMDEWSNEKENV
ncbi:hypothetical protein EKO27_g6213 [Xylaria grammica]|uniref:FAD-binding domain-containing protein n=1 Tax=Xylaria grammica TaxID=363999 RepID=A0A439D387_9PEZI|nr:hypothetical protein EKO27_g6213 [Xylaria grammica]